MSDDNSRDRPGVGTRGSGGSSKATQAGPVAAGKPGKRGAAARTMLGLPVMDPAQAQRIARAGISGRPPVTQNSYSTPNGPAPSEKDLGDSDTRYMEPPSEALGRAQTEVVPQARQPFAHEPTPVPAAPAKPSAAEPGAGLFGTSLQRANSPTARTPEPHRPAGAGLFSTSLSSMHDPDAPKPGAPRTHFTNTNQAPEAWRDDVRRMADRAPTPRPKVQPGPTASLRLKLDADAYEEQPYRAPKSALPSVLLWLLVLGLAGGAAAYYVQGHGGVNSVIGRLRGDAQPPANATPAAAPAQPAQPGTSTLPPTAADQPLQPPAAAAQPEHQQPAAQQPPSAATPTSQPTAAPAAADDSARQLADPDAPQAQPPAAAPAAKAPAAAPVKKAESKPKAAPKAPAHRHEPVVKVRPLDGTSSSAPSVNTGTDTPPTPSDMPYVPVPADPPSPDEPR